MDVTDRVLAATRRNVSNSSDGRVNAPRDNEYFGPEPKNEYVRHVEKYYLGKTAAAVKDHLDEEYASYL